MWNDSDSKTIVNWKIRPAMDSENFFETVYGLANDGKTNDEGMPNVLQVALMANRYADVFRLAKPAFAVQKIVFLFLTPIAYLFGYKLTHKKYFD